MPQQLHNTLYGREFFERQLPDLIKELKRIADALEKLEDTRSFPLPVDMTSDEGKGGLHKLSTKEPE